MYIVPAFTHTSKLICLHGAVVDNFAIYGKFEASERGHHVHNLRVRYTRQNVTLHHIMLSSTELVLP